MTIAKIATPLSWRVWLKRLSLLLILGVVVLVAASALFGYGLNLRGFGRAALDLISAVMKSNAVKQLSTGDYRNIVFLHRSVGNNLIEQGNVRELFRSAGYQFWDQGYNWQQLRDPNGQLSGYAYTVPDDNTDPDGLAHIFSQPAYNLPLNTFSALLQHEVIVFKSCFPASDIASDVQLQERKELYLKMRDAMDQHPDKLFVVVTQPPLNPAETKPEIAARARAFADWLKSDEFLKDHPNIVTFDLFDQFAENDPQAPDFNMLRQEYRRDGPDSHPNRLGNENVGPIFADFIMQAADHYRSVSTR